MSGLSCVLRIAIVIALVLAGAGTIAGVSSAPRTAGAIDAIAHAAHPADPSSKPVRGAATVGDCLHGECTAAVPGADGDCRGTAPSCNAMAPGPAAPAARAPAAPAAAFRVLSAQLLAGLDPSADPPPPRG